MLYAFLFAILSSAVSAQSPDTTLPFYEFATHNVGRTNWFVNNWASISGGGSQSLGLWVGALVGRDTVLSLSYDGWTQGGQIGSDFQPGSELAQIEADEFMKTRGIYDTTSEDAALAKSEQDIIFVYTDTTTFRGGIRNFGNLDIRVEQKSYQWAADYAEDILLIDYEITNIGLKKLRDVYVGLFIDGPDGIFADATTECPPTEFGFGYGFTGNSAAFHFLESSCEFFEDQNVAWIIENDGNPNTGIGAFDGCQSTYCLAATILRPDPNILNLSWNWWLSSGIIHEDFGPRKRSRPGRPLPYWDGRQGTPLGDGNRYYVMSNGEIDYDQFTTMVDHTVADFLPPPPDARDIVDGRSDTHALLSIGPMDLFPGEVTAFTVAIFTADVRHMIPDNFWEKMDPHNPDEFYANDLDFSDMIETATYARWIYDNPGVDTDKDGFAGDFHLCHHTEEIIVDTIILVDPTGPTPDTTLLFDTTFAPATTDTLWFVGDGTPDFRGAPPPEEPVVTFTPAESRIILEWNGLRAETTPDFFTRELDFEGYRVYLGLVRRKKEMLLQSSYDIEDYKQFYFNPERADPVNPEPIGWEIIRRPFSLEEARAAYGGGNPDWHPLLHGIDNPLRVGDSILYFAPQDWNQSDLRDTTGIHKIYPDEPYPHTLVLDSAFTSDTLWRNPRTRDSVFYKGGELTPDGKRFKYFEYRYIFENLLASQIYYAGVTTFDFGSPEHNVASLETNPVNASVEALAQNRIDSALPGGLNVIVYPNPYRIDGNYRTEGFEGRGREDTPDERVREIHFTNLPPVCDIKIYSLDGDMVREVIHDKPPDDPSAMHESWDVLSRNLQIPVSGIYYWVVETPQGDTQIGKLVLIM